MLEPLPDCCSKPRRASQATILYLIDQLPDSTGLRNEVLLYEKHRTNYDRCYRAAGAKLVIWGGDDLPAEELLTEAMGKNTAALAYVFHPWNSCPISLEKAVSMAHDRDIPVIVDAAVTLPPATNLTAYIDRGADMVTYSAARVFAARSRPAFSAAART